MAKIFNTIALCTPEKHYMVNLDKRLEEIKKLVDSRKYFTINCARQYGKTTTLRALKHYLQKEYYVIFMDFQMFGNEEFTNENTFSLSFADYFLECLEEIDFIDNIETQKVVGYMKDYVEKEKGSYRLRGLFKDLTAICKFADKPIVLMIDEVDSATNNQVFLDFLSQLRAYYINYDVHPTFHSVILAGVYDIKNLKRKLHPEEERRVNSPWNIAADFEIDMSFSKHEIAGMLYEYEADYHTGMNVDEIARLIYDYTSGYLFLVSRLCKLMDEKVSGTDGFKTKTAVWTKSGCYEQ